MEGISGQQEVSIIDKDETSEKVVNVVGGFLIEESTSAFPNGKLSFVPEDYGKKETTSLRSRPRQSSSVSNHTDPNLPPGTCKCEFCGITGDTESFLPPSRRFCTVTCCKRFSAEKRYYPYGRDEEGVAFSIRQGLVNKHRTLRPNSKMKQQNSREDRRRRLAYYSSNQSATADKSDSSTTPGRGRRGRRPGSSATPPVRQVSSNKQPSLVEPYTHPQGTTLQQWTLEDVSDFLTHLGYEAYTDKFMEHEMDGRALCLMKDHHLLMTLKLRLGPALKIIEHVTAIKLMEGIED